jgi:quercetin 2,3-dioxygenase
MKAIRRIVREIQPHWVGDGFPVRSLFSYQEGSEFDPFLLLDYAGPYQFVSERVKHAVSGSEVPPHPSRCAT